MPDYELLYFRLYESLTDAVKLLEHGKVVPAIDYLLQLQGDAEEIYLGEREALEYAVPLTLEQDRFYRALAHRSGQPMPLLLQLGLKMGTGALLGSVTCIEDYMEITKPEYSPD
jgi:hypothetical protein